jgi:hypothetical protein
MHPGPSSLPLLSAAYPWHKKCVRADFFFAGAPKQQLIITLAIKMNIDKIKYICTKMLEVDWCPKLDRKSMKILDKCDSLLEVMYLFGAVYFLESICQREGNVAVGEYSIETGSVIHRGKELEGIFFHGVWPLWISEVGTDCGPQSILFVPQVRFGPDFHHDYGIFYGDKYGSTDKWVFKYGVEVDGYVIHKKRRDKDKYRDTIVDYPVIRLLEETQNPLKWFRLVMESDDDHLNEQIEKEMANQQMKADEKIAGSFPKDKFS